MSVGVVEREPEKDADDEPDEASANGCRRSTLGDRGIDLRARLGCDIAGIERLDRRIEPGAGVAFAGIAGLKANQGQMKI